MRRETDIARDLIAWFEKGELDDRRYLGHEGPWEIFQEVETPEGPIDIVLRGVRNGAEILHGIEVKSRLSFDLLDQATKKRKYFHRMSIAYPGALRVGHHRSNYIRPSVDALADYIGIGIILMNNITIAVRRSSDKNVEVVIPLWDGHRDTCEAGSCGKARWTFWKQAIIEIDKVIAEHPNGLRPRDLILKLPREFQKRIKPRNLGTWYRKNISLVKDSIGSWKKIDGKVYIVKADF